VLGVATIITSVLLMIGTCSYLGEDSAAYRKHHLLVIVTPIAAVLGVAAIITSVLLILLAKSKFSALGKLKPPGAGSIITLLVTDIQDSTALWEVLASSE
jgi:hypothetical protein